MTLHTLDHTGTHRGMRAAATALVALAAAGALLAAGAAPAAADDAKARDIMQKVIDRDDGDNETSRMEMVLIDKDGNRRTRKLEVYRKDRGPDTTMSLMFFLTPADVAGTGFLTYDYREQDDDQWLYLPSLRNVKRIASSDKSGSFMGSDLNYSDMSEPVLDDYDLTLLKEEEVDGHMTWRIESVPRTDAVAEETGYSKSVLWVRQDNHVLLRAVRFVNNSSRRKFMQANKVEQIDGIWVVTERQMVTRDGNVSLHGTLVKISDVAFGQDLPEDMFTVRRLEKGP